MRIDGVALGLSAVLMTTTAVAQSPSQAVTVADHVARIIRSRCVACHTPGGDAPFSLTSLRDVRRRASMILQVTKSGYMPPWKPVDGHGEFEGSRRITAGEIEVLDQWVRLGTPDGSEPEAAVLVQATGWERGEPDLIVPLPSYALRADGPDVFRIFVVALPEAAAGFVRGMQFRPRNRAVHHANVRVDATAASRRLDEADLEPGYEGLIARSAKFPDGQFLGWTPGQLAPVLSDDLAWQLHGGSDLVVQLHLRPTGKVETIAPIIGFYLGARAPTRSPTMIRLGRQDLDIPPHAVSHQVSDAFTLPVDVEVRALQPHAHYRARSLQGWATRSDGSRLPLIRIDDWDMNWQDRYVLTTPIRLKAGTILSLDYTFDNSIGNPRNPDRPPSRSRWGWRSTDEMADLWIQVIADSDRDRARLQREVDVKMLTADAVGAEVLLSREPNHVNLRNDAADIYLALGQPTQALRHFDAVRLLQPHSARAWFNVALTLEALGRLQDAAGMYGEATRLDPTHSPAHNNIGALLLRAGHIADAGRAFERAVAADRGNADAQANLGLVMTAAGDSDAGLERIHRALELSPELLGRLVPHVWLLAAHADSSARRPAEARTLAERITRASRDPDAAALDALAACHAALGSFDEALRIATAAESAAPPSAPELRDAIRARIALYRKGQPFVLPR